MKLLVGSKKRLTLFVIFLVSILYWLFFVYTSGYKQSPLGIYTQIPLIVIPILGGLFGLMRATKWGGNKSIMGRAIGSLSLGMVAWGSALAMWTVYVAMGNPLPYPSPADYVFVLSQLLHAYGFIQLFKATGASFGFRNVKERIFGIGMTALIAVLSYYTLVVIGHGNSLSVSGETTMQVFFDYAYTIGTLVIVTIVASIYAFSRQYLGGNYKKPILLLLFGFVVHFFAIFFFVRTTANNTYFNGNIADILFTIAMFLENIGIINLDTRLT